jgi:hypothetical protein
MVCTYYELQVRVDRKTWTATIFRNGAALGVSACGGTRMAGFNMRCDGVSRFQLLLDSGSGGSAFKARVTDPTMQVHDLACAVPPPVHVEPVGQPVSSLRVFRSRAELGKLDRIVPRTFPFATESLVWVGDPGATPNCCSPTRLQAGTTEVRIVDVPGPPEPEDCSRYDQYEAWTRCTEAAKQHSGVLQPIPTVLARIPRGFTGRIDVYVSPSRPGL